MGGQSSKAGHDVVHNTNDTHIELNTRHVLARTAGFRLFDIHSEGSGGASSSKCGVIGGATGIGVVGEMCIFLIVSVVILWLVKHWWDKKHRHNNYKAFYRAQTATIDFAPRYPPAPTMVRSWNGPQREKYSKYQKPQRSRRNSTGDLNREIRRVPDNFDYEV